MLPCMALAPSLWLLHAMHNGLGCFEKGTTGTFAFVWGRLHHASQACCMLPHGTPVLQACYQPESSTVALWLLGQWPGLVQRVLHDHIGRSIATPSWLCWHYQQA